MAFSKPFIWQISSQLFQILFVLVVIAISDFHDRVRNNLGDSDVMTAASTAMYSSYVIPVAPSAAHS